MRSEATNFAIFTTSTASGSEERSDSEEQCDEFSVAFTSLLARALFRENKNYIVASLHSSPRFAISTTNTLASLLSSLRSSQVQLWSPNLEVGSMFDVSALGCIDRSVSGVAWDPSNKKILVGMYSSEVYEINDSEGFNIHDGPLVTGHYSQSVWSVAVNPVKPNQYVTVGSDKTVRIWDAR